LKAAYGYYNVCTTAGVTFRQLLKDALILANKAGFDVFNALDVMDNDHTFKDLQFGVGNGNLHYYLYNWRINQNLEPKDVGIILV
jgi:glycylpeptide N-tetradecanoyltransferase